MWKVDIWVQPSRSFHFGWCGPWCGPWAKYATRWVENWNDIPAVVENVTSAGLYTRQLLCVEEYEYDNEILCWVPVDMI